MLALTDMNWVILVLLPTFYLILCTRTALAMRRSGRSFWLWLPITILTTSVLATMVLMRDQRRGYNPAMLREQQAEGDLPGGAYPRKNGKSSFPDCDQKIDKARRP